MLVLCNVHICSHPLNEQQEQITLLEGGKFEWRGPGAHSVGMEMSQWDIMELCDECKNNCTKFQFYTEKAFRDIPFFCDFTSFCVLNDM